MSTSLEKLVQDASTALKQHGLILATAESCTGGGLAYWLTSLPGSSEYFERGFVTYSNQSKIDLLGVLPITIDSFGAVSEPVAREMAEGILRACSANIGIAITGIAGPAGGTPQKPVGTVWIGLASRSKPTHAVVELFEGDRKAIRDQAIQRALELLAEYI